MGDIEDLQLEKKATPAKSKKYVMTEARAGNLRKAREKRKENLKKKKEVNTPTAEQTDPPADTHDDSDDDSSIEYVITKRKKKQVKNIVNEPQSYEVNFSDYIV